MTVEPLVLPRTRVPSPALSTAATTSCRYVRRLMDCNASRHQTARAPGILQLVTGGLTSRP
jgi:hypothetical protein